MQEQVPHSGNWVIFIDRRIVEMAARPQAARAKVELKALRQADLPEALRVRFWQCGLNDQGTDYISQLALDPQSDVSVGDVIEQLEEEIGDLVGAA